MGATASHALTTLNHAQAHALGSDVERRGLLIHHTDCDAHVHAITSAYFAGAALPPTMGFTGQIACGPLNLSVLSVFGQQKIRPLWRHYLVARDVFVVAVDAHDRELARELRDELLWLARQPECPMARVGVFYLLLRSAPLGPHATAFCETLPPPPPAYVLDRPIPATKPDATATLASASAAAAAPSSPSATPTRAAAMDADEFEALMDVWQFGWRWGTYELALPLYPPQMRGERVGPELAQEMTAAAAPLRRVITAAATDSAHGTRWVTNEVVTRPPPPASVTDLLSPYPSAAPTTATADATATGAPSALCECTGIAVAPLCRLIAEYATWRS